LAFDGWQVVRNGKEISFTKAGEIDFSVKESSKKNEITEDSFLKKEFEDISIENIGLDSIVTDVLKSRIDEIKNCFSVKSSLAVIFLCGSTLEGILLGIASKNPKDFNQAKATPKNLEGKTKQFQEWTLSNFIDVSSELGYIKEDVKKFSHVLRDFRNYIHPYEQMSSNFFPDENTSKICWQVLKAAIFQICQENN